MNKGNLLTKHRKIFSRFLLRVIKLLPPAKIKITYKNCTFTRKWYKFIELLRCVLNSLTPAEREKYILTYYIPIVNILFDKNYVNIAQYTLLALEEWLLSKETDSELEEAMSLFSSHAINAGERFRKAFPLKTSPSSNKKQKIAFTSYWNDLGGFEVVLGLSKYLQDLDVSLISLYSYQKDIVESICKQYNMDFIVSPKYEKYNVFSYRKLFEDNEIDLALWVTPPFHMFFYYSFGLAPKQIWFSNYLRPNVNFKYLDGKMTLGGDGIISQKTFNNNTWEIIAQTTYVDFSYNDCDFVLFSPARLEKIKQQGFLDALVRIMKACPNTLFKWTGYYYDRDFIDFMLKNGFYSRQVFLSWMDNRGLIEEIKKSDLILSTFPLALGTTEIMASYYSKPIVSMYNQENSMYWRDPYWSAEHGNIELQKICMDEHGESIIKKNYSIDDYVENAIELINNKKLAKRYAKVYHDAYDYTFINNKNNIKEQFLSAINNCLSGCNND